MLPYVSVQWQPSNHQGIVDDLYWLTLNYSMDKCLSLSTSPQSTCFLWPQTTLYPPHFPNDGLALHKGDGWLVDWRCWLASLSSSFFETGVPQAGLDLLCWPGWYQPPIPPTPAFQVLRLQACAIALSLKFVEMSLTFLKEYFNYLLKPISSYFVKKRKKDGHDFLCIYSSNTSRQLLSHMTIFPSPLKFQISHYPTGTNALPRQQLVNWLSFWY